MSADVQRITLNASCMMISGERTEQLNIFCRVTGFTSDFLSFIDVELTRFFHRALQLYFYSTACYANKLRYIVARTFKMMDSHNAKKRISLSEISGLM